MRVREYRKIVAILREHDSRFEFFRDRGKGSHRMIFHPDIDGRKRHYPLPYRGEKTPIESGYQKKMIRMFELPPDIFD